MLTCNKFQARRSQIALAWATPANGMGKIESTFLSSLLCPHTLNVVTAALLHLLPRLQASTSEHSFLREFWSASWPLSPTAWACEEVMSEAWGWCRWGAQDLPGLFLCFFESWSSEVQKGTFWLGHSQVGRQIADFRQTNFSFSPS